MVKVLKAETHIWRTAYLWNIFYHYIFGFFRAKMSFATKHISSHLREVHASKDNTGDFSLVCHGEIIRAHSFVLCMG